MDANENMEILMNSEDEANLITAIKSKDTDLVRHFLCEKNISPNFVISGSESPVCVAASIGNGEIFDLLVRAGVNLSTPLYADQMWNRRPIHLAASKGNTNIIKILVENGIDVNCRDNEHRTPLHWASTFGNCDSVEFLIQKGACVNFAQKDGFTPLHAATCLGHNSVCKLLIDNGAEVNKADRDGWNALHTAVCHNRIGVVKTLLANKALPNLVNSDEENALHICIAANKPSKERLEIAKILVDHNVSLNCKNMLGFTAFHFGLYYGLLEMCIFLVSVGADIQTVNSSGQTPLYLAALRTYENFIQLLVHAGYNFSKDRWILDNKFPVTCQENLKLCQILNVHARNARSLQDICCFRVRKMLGRHLKEKTDELPLPKSLKDKLTFKNISMFRFQREFLSQY